MKFLKMIIPFLVLLVGSCTEEFNNPMDENNTDAVPEPPFNLVASVQGDSLVALTWSARLNYGFSVFRDDVEVQKIAYDPNSVEGGDFSFTDRSQLDINRNIVYKVSSLLPNGQSSGLQTSILIEFNKPSTPTIEFVSETEVRLSWSDMTQMETGYKVERSRDSQDFSEIALLPPNSTTYTDAGPIFANTLYSYKVSAITSRNTAESDPASFQFTLNPVTEGSISFDGSRAVDLAWEYDSNQKHLGFKLERSNNGIFEHLDSLGPNIRTYRHERDLSHQETISYRISAVTKYSKVNSEAFTVTALLDAPTEVTSGIDSINSWHTRVTWKDNSNIEDGFRIEKSVDGADYSILAEVEKNTTHITDTDSLFPGQSVIYRVQAQAHLQPSSYGFSPATTGALAPVTPGNVYFRLPWGSSFIDGFYIGWTNNSDQQTGIEIYRSENGIDFTLLTTLSGDATTYHDLSPYTFGQQYFWQIVPLNGDQPGRKVIVNQWAGREILSFVYCESTTSVRYIVQWVRQNIPFGTTNIEVLQRLSNGDIIVLNTYSITQALARVTPQESPPYELAARPVIDGFKPQVQTWITVDYSCPQE